MSMIETGNCWDTVVNGIVGEDEFENVLNFLDFPMEDIEGMESALLADWDISNPHCLGPIPHDLPIFPPKVPDCKIDARPPHLLSDRISHSATQQIIGAPQQEKKPSNHIQSPVSVLESNVSSLNPPTYQKISIPVGPRSKRARRANTNPWPFSFSAPFSAPQKQTKYNERRMKKPAKKEYSRKSEVEYSSSSSRPKKCTHCEVTKTPQWREGPLGPKTLCNACGVRYRSGRLFPEYRPAASPTFAPSLHSNSHKKVIEMRNRGKFSSNIIDDYPNSPQPEFVPNPMGSSILIDYI